MCIRDSCGIEFKSVVSRRMHMELMHSNLNRVKCELCDRVGSKNQIARHMEFTHKVKNIICDGCGKVCKKEADLVTHHRKVHKVFECNTCKEKCVGDVRYKAHLETHGIIKRKYIPKLGRCQQCDFVCKGESMLKYHVYNVHTPNHEKPHQCDCGKGYGSYSHLLRHWKSCPQKPSAEPNDDDA